MLEYYDKIFRELKQYIESNSIYSPKVVKKNNNKAAYFPTIVCMLSNLTFTDSITTDKRESYNQYFITTDIYTKNKVVDGKTIASDIINQEISNLVLEYFKMRNLRVTLCQPTPNLDIEVDRRTIRAQCMINNYGNIIRR